MKRALGWLVVAGLFAVIGVTGCVTVQNSKTMTIRPTDAPVTVTSTARASCRDVFFVLWCRLNMAMESSNGEKVSDFSK